MPETRIKLTEDLMCLVILSVSERTGNMVNKKQLNMIESILTKRALSLGLLDEASYINYFKKHQEEEIEHLISIFTTHHSFFFREFEQFEYLKSNILPNLVEQIKNSGRKKIRIWSAACSNGQEAYSLFMYIDQYVKNNNFDLEIEVLGTDIDRVSVKFASNGVYTWDEVKEIPLLYLSKYWTRGTGEISKFAKLKESVRKHFIFKPLNLMETQTFQNLGKFDIIFCRNVLAYFKKSDIETISDAFAGTLNSEGYLFVGPSEILPRSPNGMIKKSPSIYGTEKTPNSDQILEKRKMPVRVFCVDDSPSILKILEAILTTDNGFEIVATATNGAEAAKKIKDGLMFDIMTLDIHMPELDGIDYLEKHYTTAHPPIVVLASAARDSRDLALKALSLGAKDYIEKPGFNNLALRANEIRTKLKTFIDKKEKMSTSKTDLELDEKSLILSTSLNSSQAAQVIFVDENANKFLTEILTDKYVAGIPTIVVNTQFNKDNDPLLIKLNAIPSLASKIRPLDLRPLQTNFYYTDIDDFEKYGPSALENRKFCYMFLTNLSRSQWNQCPRRNLQKILILENLDRSVFSGYLPMLFISPASSFAYIAKEFLLQALQKTA